MYRRKALLNYTGDRTGPTSMSDSCVSQVQVMAASPVVRAGRRIPGGNTSPHSRISVRDGQQAAKGPLEPFHTERRLESTTAEADAWVGRRVRACDLHLPSAVFMHCTCTLSTLWLTLFRTSPQCS